MKNRIIYYLMISIPLVITILLKKNEMISSPWFIFSLLFYLFIYRTYVDGKRLVDKNVITKDDQWKLMIPGVRLKYFTELYF